MRRHAESRKVGLRVLVASVLLAAACEKKRDEPLAGAAANHGTSTGARAVEKSVDRPASISLEQIGLVHREAPVRLDDHSWDTEHVNEAAGHQLKELAKLLARPGELTAEAVIPLLAEAFHCSRLRPDKLTPVFSHGALTVHRVGSGSTLPIAGATASAFVQHLRDLFAAVPAPAGVHANFKIFRVSAEPATAETSVRMELVARGEGKAIQQTAQWKCHWQRIEGQKPRLVSLAVESFEEVATATGPHGGPSFSDATETVLGNDPAFREQLAFSVDHWVARIEQQFVFGPSGWEGLAMGDANGDGREDLYVCQPGGLPNRLFLQNVDGTLTDRARECGVDWWDQTQAALFCDFDNDGDQDLAIATIWGLLFLANDGHAHFSASAAKVTPEGMPYSLAAADFDGDSDLDLYVCCYSKRANAVEQKFLARPIPYHDANNGSRNILFRNDRQWRFRDVTKKVGLDENNQRFSFAAAWEDFDGDGDLDLYVANDFGRNNLYRCDRLEDERIGFTDVAAAAGVEDISAGMSAAWGDADNDGRPDLYVSNMWSSAGNRVAYQRRFHEGASPAALASFQRHAKGNSLFLNAGDGTFRDISEAAGVAMGRWAWGSRFVDLNNDGFEDLVVANGYITQPDSGDL
ncbi:MAG: FG-GAP repeat domain-containing protein [Verrucomicrobiales bacterium]